MPTVMLLRLYPYCTVLYHDDVHFVKKTMESFCVHVWNQCIGEVSFSYASGRAHCLPSSMKAGSSVQSNAVQYSAIQRSPVQYGTVQYSTVQNSKVYYRTVQYSTVQ